MKKAYILYLIIVLTAWNSKEILAQQYWTLEKSILHAWEANLAVEQSQLGIESAEINYTQARQERLPSLSANSSVGWNFGRTIDPTTNDFITQTFFSNNYGLNSGMTLFNGLSITNNIKRSKILVDASEADLKEVKNNIGLQVANAFLQVLFARENIEISQRQLVLTQQQLDQTLRSIKAGATPDSERLNLEAQVIQTEQQLIDAENNFDIAMLQLKQLLRLPPDEDMEIMVPENIIVSIDPDSITFQQAFATALKNRPELDAAVLRQQSAELDVELAKSSFYPSIFVGGNLSTVYSNNPFVNKSFQDQLDNNLSYGFGAQMNIPIYSNGRTHASVQQAEIGVANSRITYLQIIENLQVNVQQALANARASKKTLEASTKALEAQQLAFDNTTKRLEIGAANTFEWEAQKTQLENTEFTRIIDKYNYLFNIKMLEFYLGKPLKL